MKIHAELTAKEIYTEKSVCKGQRETRRGEIRTGRNGNTETEKIQDREGLTEHERRKGRDGGR